MPVFSERRPVASDVVGDGTTTATVLAQAIVAECKCVAAGMNPMDLKCGIDKAVEPTVNEEIKIVARIDDEERRRKNLRYVVYVAALAVSLTAASIWIWLGTKLP